MDGLASHLTLLGSAAETGANLQEALLRSWAIAGNGPLAFPFAFLSGIRAPATFVAMSGSAVLPEVTLLLLLLLYRREWRPASAILFAALTSTLALSSETLFLVVIGALAGGLVIALILGRRYGWDRPDGAPGWADSRSQPGDGAGSRRGLHPTVPVRCWLVDAGLRLCRNLLAWPPRIVSAHLGSLQVGDPGQLLLSLVEAGPAVLLLPLTMAWSRYIRRGMSFPEALAR
jgi:hypothetical protein